MVAGRAVGLGLVEDGGLRVTGLVSGTYLQHVLARRRLPGVVPLPPGVDRVLSGELRLVPGAIDADLDRLDASVLRPRDAGDHYRARGDVAPRRVDARLGLDRRLLR